MDVLINRRKALNLKVTTLKTAVDQHGTTPLDKATVTLLIEKANNFRRENDEINNGILELCKCDTDIVNNQVQYEVIEEPLCKIKISLTNINDTLGVTTISKASTVSDIKLPKLDLPTFNGDLHQWLSFHDLFIASVHSSPKLSGAQKLQYLKSCVKGEAANLIQSIAITDANYDEAWNKLQDRYQNSREIIKNNFERLLSQPNITQENPMALRKLVDTTTECLRAFDVLKISPELYGHLITIHIISKKLDPESRLQWERSLKKEQLPEINDFTEFLDQHARVTAAAGIAKGKPPYVKPQSTVSDKKPTAVHHGATKISCVLCSGEHYLYKCEQFNAKTVPDRLTYVKNNHLCYNCLIYGHSTKDCKSKYRCKECKSLHHSLLHLVQSKAPSVEAPKQSDPPPVASTLASNQSVSFAHVLLSTAIIYVKDCFGKDQMCRALVDNGSMSSIISESCAQRLKLNRKNINIPLTGIGAVGAGASHGCAQVQVSSKVPSKFTANLNMLILPKVTSILPYEKLEYSSWTHIENLKLADPKFYEPGAIDILLGNDVFADILCSGKIKGPEGTPTALETVFGWILGGRTRNNTEPSVSLNLANFEINETLQKFWELEELPKKRFLTPDEKLCEDHFDQTHSREADGRYVVKLPFKQDAEPLGESRTQAITRLKQVERRLSKDPDLQSQYNAVLQEYLDLNHMEEINPGEINQDKKNVYYLPHHAVFKESTSTKLRVVFDASAKSSSGVSLNDNLLIGPKLQDDLISILMRFRIHPVAFTADIVKMYRQFRVHKDDTNSQRIVWRKSPEEPIKDYRLLTATFGTASAPYLAIKCLQQLSTDEGKDFPEAAEVLKKDTYVDDIMSGSFNTQQAIATQKQLRLLTQRGRLELRKWSSNSSEFLQSLPPELVETKVPLRIDLDESIKTLGLHWHPAQDFFQFSVSTPKPVAEITKRTVASEIAKVFDPLGWLSPVTIKSKILLQELWKRNIDWNDTIPDDLNIKYQKYLEDLPAIETIQIPRCITQIMCGEASELVPEGSLPLDPKSHPPSYRLLGFCDASETAYAAVSYLQVIQDGKSSTNIIASKTKVAPLKIQSIPRLELCGALLLTRLLETVQESLSIDISEVHAWTDSTIVLAWLASPPHRWKTFVANRVSEIQETIPKSSWHHVRSELNPADYPSRGISPSELKDLKMWWNGPDFLSANIDRDDQVYEPCEIALLEERQKVNVHLSTMDFSLLQKYSSLNKLKRHTAYWLRFINNCRARIYSKEPNTSTMLSKWDLSSGPITPNHLNSALTLWIKLVQAEVFHDEVLLLKKKLALPARCKILPLNPFLDADGVLRVGGRLRNAPVHVDRKYPILLPKKHYLTDLILSHYHTTNLHAGPQAMLSAISEKYWIISGRDVVRRFVMKCVTCFRVRANSAQQMMGDLPGVRLNPGRPFIKCGVDYAGPFTLRISSDRPTRRQPLKTTKAYLALFVCFTTHALHLELVSDMTSESFIAALKRFISRRGKCSDIYSDCGTNFVGANKEIKEFLRLTQSNDFNTSVQTNLADQGINWHFNPPASPHFGGLWEAGVKSVKYHLKRIVGNQVMNFEQMYTVFTQIEACLNSRPITPTSSNPDDLTALTPAHFIIGDTFSSIPEPDLTEVPINRLTRWQKSQQFVQHFWRRWSSEHLSRLQQRPKWWSQKENIAVGDLVILKDDQLPPCKWKLGRILQLYPGKDNLVRVALVKTAEGEFKRPIVKLALLPIDKNF